MVRRLVRLLHVPLCAYSGFLRSLRLTIIRKINWEIVKMGIPKTTIAAVQRSLIHILRKIDRITRTQITSNDPLTNLKVSLNTGVSKKQKLINAIIELTNHRKAIDRRMVPKNAFSSGVKRMDPHASKKVLRSIFCWDDIQILRLTSSSSTSRREARIQTGGLSSLDGASCSASFLSVCFRYKMKSHERMPRVAATEVKSSPPIGKYVKPLLPETTTEATVTAPKNRAIRKKCLGGTGSS